MYRSLFFIVALFSSANATANSGSHCVKVEKSEIEALFDKWNASLKTGNPDLVVENYLSDAVLIPTLSNKVRLTNEERKEYFQDFLKKKPSGKIDSRSIRIGCNKAIDIGTYTFTFYDGTEVSSRYTFTYAWDGEWKISTHHSSVMPERN